MNEKCRVRQRETKKTKTISLGYHNSFFFLVSFFVSTFHKLSPKGKIKRKPTRIKKAIIIIASLC